MAQQVEEIAKPPTLQTRNITMGLKVPDYNAASHQIVDAVVAEGGELSDAHTDVTHDGRRHGWLRLRVPSDRIPDLLPRLRPVGNLWAERVTTADHASQYDSLRRRVERLQQHEQRLGGVLTRRSGLRGSDILYLQERLFRASVDESLLAQEREDIARSGSLSTLSINLFEPLPIRARDRAAQNLAAHYASAREHAGDQLQRYLQRAATASAFAVVFAPLYLVPFATVSLVLWLLWRRWSRPVRVFVTGTIVPLVAPLVTSAFGALRRRLMALKPDVQPSPVNAPTSPTE